MRSGFAPERAAVWLALQQAHALHPEQIAPRLREGADPESLLSSEDRAMLRRGGVGADAWVDARADGGSGTRDRAHTPLDRLVLRHAQLGIGLVPLGSPGYPALLDALDDPPLVLSVRGDAARLGDEAIAIVGARAASVAARRFARGLAFDLARAGFTIVSGLARGIDAEAHRGALEAGGVTIGVLACGVDRVYPPEHRSLVESMLERGAVVSELPLGTIPRPLHFPLRNRIISGLVRGLVVVEARSRSGSLITVRHALAQGREVFVVPGSIEGPFAVGTNRLLREGARAISSAGDLLEDLGRPPQAAPRRGECSSGGPRDPGPSGREVSMSPSDEAARIGEGAQSRVLALLRRGARTRDELLSELRGDSGGLAAALLELELAGRILLERDGRIHACGRP